jgi:hypothetical protein
MGTALGKLMNWDCRPSLMSRISTISIPTSCIVYQWIILDSFIVTKVDPEHMDLNEGHGLGHLKKT